MTGFARGTVTASDGLQATVTFKSVNHRFLDIQMRLPSGFEAIEAPLRNAIKQAVLRGHVDVYIQMERSHRGSFDLNVEALDSYVAAFRNAAAHADLQAEPDLNQLLRLPGVVANDAPLSAEEIALLESAIVAQAPHLLAQMNQMREHEGASLAAELRLTMQNLDAAVTEAESLRDTARQVRFEKMQFRIAELTQGAVDADRVLQEAAMLADRADIEEEMVRLKAHVRQFSEILEGGAETGKKLDFLLQEMNREANTLLSKTSGAGNNAMRVTEIGLAMKAAIEKAREQIQNLE